MMRRLLLVAAFGAVGLTAVPDSVVAQTPPASSEAGELSPAARTLSRCLQDSGRLSVLVLADESGSLATTDPKDLRVDGVRAALTGLERLADTSIGKAKPEVDVLIAGFSGRVLPDPGRAEAAKWRRLSPATIDALLEDAGRIADRDFAADTDYATALLGARRLLAAHERARTADGAKPPCQALLWFTDGRFEITSRTADKARRTGLPMTVEYAPGVRLDTPGGGEQAVKAGRALLCKDGGLMDGLSQDGIVKFTVALATRIPRKEARFLEALTNGLGGCGAELSPADGEYIRVDGSSQLYFAFSDLFTGEAETRSPEGVCEMERCPEGSAKFSLADGIARVLVRAETGSDAVEIALAGPRGGEVRLRPSGKRVLRHSDADIKQRWVSPRAVEVEMQLPPEAKGWQGRWSLVFIDVRGVDTPLPRYVIQRFSGLRPELVGAARLVRGRSTPIGVQLAATRGQAVEGNPLLESAALTTQVVLPGVAPRPGTARPLDAKGASRVEVVVPQDSTSTFGFLDVDLELDVGDGFSIEPVERSFRLPVDLPADQGYPLITPEQLDLGAVEGSGTTAGTITVTGSRDSEGCVFVPRSGGGGVRGPDTAGQIAMSVQPYAVDAGSCLKVRPGERKALKVTFDPARPAVGTARGEVRLAVISSEVEGTQPANVMVRFELLPERNVGRRWAIFALLMVVGFLLPLLLLHALNYAFSRFPSATRIRAIEQEVRIGADGRLEPVDEPHLRRWYRDTEPLALGNEPRRRKLRVGPFDLETIATFHRKDGFGRAISGLFRGPYAVVTAGRAPVAAGSLGTPAHGPMRAGRAHRVPLALGGTWLLALRSKEAARDEWGASAEDGRPVGTLVVLVAEGASPDQTEKLMADAQERLRTWEWPEEPLEPDEQTSPGWDLEEPSGGASGTTAERTPEGASNWLDDDSSSLKSGTDGWGFQSDDDGPGRR